MTTTTLPTIVNIPPGPASTLTVETMKLLTDSIWRFIAPGGKLVWHLGGGKAPWPGVEEGMSLQSISGLMPPGKLKDQQGSGQDGVTNTGLFFDPAEIDMTLSANAPLNPATMLPDPNGMRRIMRWWTESWAGNRQGKLSCITPELGEWWQPVRQFKPIIDQFKLSYAQTGQQTLQWSARGDDAFWFSFDSASEFGLPAGQDVSNGWLPLVNRGTQPGWPRYLCYGPGSFDIGDGLSGKTVSFGPLLENQVVLITTLPRLRSVIDLTPADTPVPAQLLNPLQRLLQDLIEFATNNNTPPLLQMFESWFGIRPPQGQLYGLLSGRFDNPLPGIEEGQLPPSGRIPVTIRPGEITTANYLGPLGIGGLLPTPGSTISPIPGVTRIVAALTPMRIWPE
jgi:hypothetical protein